MPQQNLTVTFIEKKVKLPPKGQRVEWYDIGDTSNLCLRVSDKGTKTWCVWYRLDHERDGKGRLKPLRLTLDAPYPAIGLAEAREKARQIRLMAKRGIDPREELERQRQEAAEARAATFGKVAEEFVEKYAKRRQRTWKETERVLTKTCAAWSKRPISAITKRDAYDLLDGFIADGHEAKARVTVSWLRTFWRWAWERDYVTAPIMDAVKIEVDASKSRDRVYSDDEILALWNAKGDLTALESGFLKLVILLGVRKNELAGMRWDELDDPDKPTLWTIPHARVKIKKSAREERSYLVTLSPLAQRIIRGLPKADDDLVFPGRHHGKPMDPGTWFQRKVQKASGVKGWGPHAHRHTMATWLENAGYDKHQRALALNHSEGGGVTAGYSHGFPLDKKRAVMEAWSDHVESVVKPEGAAAVLR